MPINIFLSSLFILLFGWPSKANYKYAEIITLGGESIEGELIRSYEAKWFWEDQNTKGPKYWGVFRWVNGSPLFDMVPHDQVKSLRFTTRATSLYQNYFAAFPRLYFKGTPLEGENYVSTGSEGHHLLENMFGHYAYDIEKYKNLKSHKSNGLSNTDYYVWGEDISSPIAGRVVEIVRNANDNKADPDYSSDLSKVGFGNYILLHIVGPFYFVMVHLQKDSIPANLVKGSQVKVGDLMGRVGNSGVSYTPHVHMTLYAWSKRLHRMISVPSFFVNVERVGGGDGVLSDPIVPKGKQVIRLKTRCSDLF